MKRLSKKKTSSLIALILGLWAITNYNWVHAAVVYGISDSNCDSSLIQASHDRVQKLFGSVESKPWIVCLEEPVLNRGILAGTANFSPGLPSVIILAREGINQDVMAHEWVHAELAERVGVVARTYRLPTWFDEGLAMQVDEREPYNHIALDDLRQREDLVVPQALDLLTPAAFFVGGDQGRLHYSWSKERVADWLAINELLPWLAQYSMLHGFDFSGFD